ncbi:hypothetical protein [Thermococcus sp.]|uniref:hypothetical protein n=1 Tax=Thermococcus sp. TaxID=35749 RepID=UPI0019A15EAA|nr:hypothetical protein [Thermococcus sp.]MBC7095417.1 hypothetical protein [Thermococcus sp.]
MKKLIPLMFIMLFTFALAQAEWQGNGVNIEYNDTILKATGMKEGFNTLISPLTPTNTTLRYSFLIKGENTNGVLAEIAYFDENGTFIFAKNVTLIGNGTFDWKNVSIVALPFENARFASLVIIINGTGTVYVDKFSVSEFESPKAPPKTQTETPEETETTTAPQEFKKETVSNETENLQRLLIDDENIRVEIFLKSTYSPGDTIRADFYITNKKGFIDEVDIKLDVYYFGIKVFSYEHPSWREYSEGKTIHIFHEAKLPMITPPGKYVLRFYITPVGRETKEVSATITVKPSAVWFLFVIALITIFYGVAFLIKRYWKRIVRIYREFSVGQRFVFFAIIGLITAAVILALGAESYANNVAIVVYCLLVIGVLNEWIEYLEPRWDRKDIWETTSIFLLALLMWLSKDTLTVYPAVVVFVLAAVDGITKLRPKDKESRRNRGIEEIEIIGETEEGFIILKTKGEKDKKVHKGSNEEA